MLSPTAPRLVGTTVSVTVSCPARMEINTSGTCTAYGYDSNNVFTNSNVTSWTSSNTSAATISSSGAVTASSTTGGNVTITAVVDGISGSTNLQVVVPITVAIDGPTSAKPNAPCYFGPIVTGGVPPFSYQWIVIGGSGYADGNGYIATGTSGSYKIRVTVTDDVSSTATATQTVTISTSAPVCPY